MMTEEENAARARRTAADSLLMVAYEKSYGGIEAGLKQAYPPQYLDQDWTGMLLRIDVADIMNSLTEQ
jgi:hypothetical protein